MAKRKKKKKKNGTKTKMKADRGGFRQTNRRTDVSERPTTQEEREREEACVRERIEALKKTAFELQRYNSKLRSQKRENQVRMNEFLAYFKAEVESREKECMSLEKEVKTQMDVADAGRKQIESHYFSQIEDAQKRASREQSRLTSEIVSKGAQLKSLSMQEVKKERFEYDRRTTDLKRQIEEKISKCREHTAILERDLLAKTAQHKNEIEKMLARVQSEVWNLSKRRPRLRPTDRLWILIRTTIARGTDSVRRTKCIACTSTPFTTIVRRAC